MHLHRVLANYVEILELNFVMDIHVYNTQKEREREINISMYIRNLIYESVNCNGCVHIVYKTVAEVGGR